MNEEPKRLLDEDPDGAAGLLIRAALKDGPPPPKGAKERAAKQLGLESATVIPWRGRRIAAWSAGATILAAAAGVVFFVLPQKAQMEPVASEPAMPAPTATAPPMSTAPSEAIPPAPAATAMPLPMATSMPPVKSATAGSARPPSSAKSGAPKSPPAPKKLPEQFKF